jgi:hypothetical protein
VLSQVQILPGPPFLFFRYHFFYYGNACGRTLRRMHAMREKPSPSSSLDHDFSCDEESSSHVLMMRNAHHDSRSSEKALHARHEIRGARTKMHMFEKIKRKMC